MLSQCKMQIDILRHDSREWCGANDTIRANDAARIERFGRLPRELKNLNFGGYSRHVNQSGACSSSDVITM